MSVLEQWAEYLTATGASHSTEFGHIDGSDLTKGIPRPKTPRAVARPIGDDTIAKLLTVTLSPRAHAYVRLALYEALRVHEIAALRGEDFDCGG